MNWKSSTQYFLNLGHVCRGGRISGSPNNSVSVSVVSVSSSVLSASDPDTDEDEQTFVGVSRDPSASSVLPVENGRGED